MNGAPRAEAGACKAVILSGAGRAVCETRSRRTPRVVGVTRVFGVFGREFAWAVVVEMVWTVSGCERYRGPSTRPLRRASLAQGPRSG